ncbi:MAG: L,D-transpeptidase family protein [Cyclobacteriaceae bacterium]
MRAIALIILACTMMSSSYQTNFLKDQKRYSRVRTAIAEKEKIVVSTIEKNGIGIDELNILISAYKAEKELEVYAKRKGETTYQKVSTYSICSNSGQLGPKRKQGDSQVPEGFYYVDRFNPASNFLLSLGLNYPNQSDRKKSSFTNLGGDIFIHGSCVTIGCLPMTDDKIREIYVYALHARNNGQSKIPVYIYPFKMTDENFAKYKEKNMELENFWANLKTGFDKFDRDKNELNVSVARNGDYTF